MAAVHSTIVQSVLDTLHEYVNAYAPSKLRTVIQWCFGPSLFHTIQDWGMWLLEWAAAVYPLVVVGLKGYPLFFAVLVFPFCVYFSVVDQSPWAILVGLLVCLPAFRSWNDHASQRIRDHVTVATRHGYTCCLLPQETPDCGARGEDRHGMW